MHKNKLPSVETMQQIADQRVERKQAAGIVIATLNLDGETRLVTAGSKGAGGGAPDGDTLFEIGSVTKCFTATLLADMTVRGEVSLEDAIGQFLPFEKKLPERKGKQISLLDLATHTSGLPKLASNQRPVDALNPYADYSLEQLYEFLAGYQLTRDIGAEYEYSNLGYGLLGHILGLRLGTSWEAAVSERVLGPLGMEDTCVTPSGEQRSRLATGHNAGGNPVPNWDIPTLAGMGALRSSVKDLLKFLAANMIPERSPLAEALCLTHIPRRSAWDEWTKIGLAWQIGHEGHASIVRHSGGTGGSASFIGYDPLQGYGVIVLANSAPPVFDIGFHLIDPRFPLDEP